MEEIIRRSAIDIASSIRRGDFTGVQLVEQCLSRIEEREPLVGAWAHLDREYALAQARELDAAAERGEWRGPLHGVPVGVKDIVDTAELPTENGTPIFLGRRPAHDAEIAKNLRAAGAVILGKTVTTELAFFGPGKTRNPKNPNHTPGGSSSGSAAAVADFHVPLAIGTQTAGSIIRPASYCGVIGFKPTFGVVPCDGVLEQSSPLDTIGGYARSVDDLTLLIDAMSGAFKARTAATPRATGKAPRLAFIKTHAWPEGDASMQAAIEAFVRSLGSAAAEVPLPSAFDGTGGLQRAVQFRDIAKNFGPHLDAHPESISAKLAEVIGIGRAVTASEYEAALERREPLYQSLSNILSEFDAILTPAAQGVAPRGLSSTGSPMFNFLWTYLGMPAISLPLLEVDGLPLGVQLVGARNGDAHLRSVANQLMSLTDS